MTSIFAWFVLLTLHEFVNSELVKTMSYWDCCKPSCAWDGKAPVSEPVLSCSVDGWTTEGISSEERDGCDGGNAFACNFHAPWEINDTLSYGFVAGHVRGQGEWDWCCACYELTFTSEKVSGKKMIVQMINTVGWPDENYFNLLIPGAGLGTFSGCRQQWGVTNNVWGNRYSGVKQEKDCNQLPTQLRSGCKWRFSWFKGAENPFAEFRLVPCPQEILNKTQCQRNVPRKYVRGQTNRTHQIRMQTWSENHMNNLFLYTLVAIPLAILLLIAIPIFLVCRLRTKHKVISKSEVYAFFKGEHEQGGTGGENIATTLCYNKELYEIPHSAFKIDMTQCLGVGEFGKACVATVKLENCENQVAVKMIRRISRGGGSYHENKFAILGLLSEIKLLAYIGKHEHIVSLVGAYTEKLSAGQVYVFLELCKLGSLHKYLQNLSLSNGQAGEIGKSIFNEQLYCSLSRWAIEIADGMEYLATKRLVHADLATRNVLLNCNKTAKIADFGLSRRLYDYTNYIKQQNQEPLPWRWMSPESLRRLVFNEKTDVWSFGVTLWEMYTLGDLPYPGLNWETGFPSRLEKGLRLDEPKNSVDGIYYVMIRCWDVDPEKRPTFAKLKEQLINQSKRFEKVDSSRRSSDESDSSARQVQLRAQENVYTVLDAI